LRIIYIHQYFNTPEMDGGTRSFEMARRMVAAGHEVHIVTSQRNSDALSPKRSFETREEGINVHWIVNPYSNYMGFYARVLSFARFAILASRKAAKLSGDIVFATSTPLTIAIPGLYASYRNKCSMVFEVRDLWPDGPIQQEILKNPVLIFLARWLEKVAYRNSAYVIALSPGMKEGIVEAGFPEDRVIIIPNSSDIGFFRVPESAGKEFLWKNPHLKDGPLVTYAGTLGISNGVGYLADIAERVFDLNPGVKFLVVGDGKEKKIVEEHARRLGVLGKNFWMMPAVPKKDMPAILSACTLSLSLFIDRPHLQRNSANKVFDTFAAGKPLAINHEGWIADILRATGAGIVLPERNAKEAARKLVEFVDDGERLKKARFASAKLADESFHRDKLARQLIDILERTISETGNRP